MERLGASPVLRVPEKNNIAPSMISGVHSGGHELTDSTYCDSFAVHASDGQVEWFPDRLVESRGLKERPVGVKAHEALTPERLVGTVGLGHTCTCETLRSGGPVWEAFLGDAALTGRKVVVSPVVGLTWVRLPRA